MSIYLKIILIFFSLISSLCAQSTFSRYYDLKEKNNETFPTIHNISEETLLLVGQGTCNNIPCAEFSTIDTFGNMLNYLSIDSMYVGRRSYFKDSLIYFTGGFIKENGLFEFDGFRLMSVDLNGNILNSSKYSLNDLANTVIGGEIERYLPYGVIRHHDKFVVYGQMRYRSDPLIYGGLITWFNSDFSLDTMVVIEPHNIETELWDAAVDTNGVLTIMFHYDDLVNHEEKHFSSFIKFDLNRHEIFRLENPPELFNRNYLHVPMLILDDGSIVTYIENPEWDGVDIIRFASNGELLWRFRIDAISGGDSRVLGDIIQTDDDNIVGIGRYQSPRERMICGHMFKLNIDNGELIWERAYMNWISTNPFFVLSLLFTGYELESGNIILVGNYSEETIDSSGQNVAETNLWVMKVDQEGCYSAECGGLTQTVLGEPINIPNVNPASVWYYSNPEADGGIYKESLCCSTTGTLLRTDFFLDPKDDWLYDEINEHFFFESEGHSKIYYYNIVDRDTILLYDFTLDIGDSFVSAYTDHSLEVIETGTMKLTNNASRRYWILASDEFPNNTIKWIEGLGTYYGFLWPPNFPSGDYGDNKLNCYYRHEQLYHMHPDVSDCFGTTNTEELIPETKGLKVFPNPTGQELHVSHSNISNFDIAVTDINGRRVVFQECFSSSCSIDVSALNSGIYFLQTLKDGYSEVVKFIKK